MSNLRKKKQKLNENILQNDKVIPSYRTVSRTKHKLAILQKKNIALSLIEKPENVKATLHYDTANRKKITVELTSLVVEFSGGQIFYMKPLPILRETQENIANFMIELKRLATASG
jgi:hypothetical protein